MVDLVWDEKDWDENDWAASQETIQILGFMLDTLPHWWNKTARTSPGSNTFEILSAFATEFAVFSEEVQNMRGEIFVDTSTGTFLDSLGLFYLLSRKSGESDSDFRGRIKSFRTTFAGGGTKDAIETAISQEFDGAVAVVTDNPGTSWAKADVTINSSDFIGKIQPNLAGYLDLLDNVKAAGIFLKTIIALINPVFDETFPHGELVTIGAGNLIIETSTLGGDVVTFSAGLAIGGTGMVWDVDNWDDSDWESEFFDPLDIVTFDVSFPVIETTTLGGELVTLGVGFFPVDTNLQAPDVLTFDAQLALTDDLTPTDIFTIALDLNLTPVPETISHLEDVTQQIFLNIPDNLVWDVGDWDLDDWGGDEEFAQSEDVTFDIQNSLSDSITPTETVLFNFNLIWDGTGQEGQWDTGNWS